MCDFNGMRLTNQLDFPFLVFHACSVTCILQECIMPVGGGGGGGGGGEIRSSLAAPCCSFMIIPLKSYERKRECERVCVCAKFIIKRIRNNIALRLKIHLSNIMCGLRAMPIIANRVVRIHDLTCHCYPTKTIKYLNFNPQLQAQHPFYADIRWKYLKY